MSSYYERSGAKRAARWFPVAAALCTNFTLACGSEASGPAADGSAVRGASRESSGVPDSACGASGGSGGTSTGGSSAAGGAWASGGDSTAGTFAAGGASTGGGSFGSGGAPARAERQRVVGYIQTFRLHDGRALDFSTLTHLNLAFATSKGGVLDFPAADRGAIPDVVARAKRSGVKVLAAIAGGDADAVKELSDALSRDVPGVVDKILELVKKYDLDGVDIDIEGEQIDPVTYPKLMDELAARLPSDKVLSAAVANWLSENYGSLDKADFLNLMSYDQCGGWSGPCEHSTLSAARDDLARWSAKTSPDKLVLGVPFYGVCWGTACNPAVCEQDPEKCMKEPPTFPYETLVSGSFASSAICQPDVLEGEGYYVSLNGPATLASKVELSKNYGGVMIWELGQDTRGGELFSAIRNSLHGEKPNCGN